MLDTKPWLESGCPAANGARAERPARESLPIIRNHHERWDGSDYLDGLRGEDIPLLARILQIADIYDALVSQRPYKRGFTHDEAISLMRVEPSAAGRTGAW